jgi:hypothetical protein
MTVTKRANSRKVPGKRANEATEKRKAEKKMLSNKVHLHFPVMNTRKYPEYKNAKKPPTNIEISKLSPVYSSVPEGSMVRASSSVVSAMAQFQKYKTGSAVCY